jgi:UDP-3-O-[3-hydroxymyristoyl] glucosamine N-acyltransferase
MNDLAFFRSTISMSLAAVALECGVDLPAGADPERLIRAAASLDGADHEAVSVLRPGLTADDLASSRAAACLVAPTQRGLLPAGTIELVVPDPGRMFDRLAILFHPDSARPAAAFGAVGINPAAIIHREAWLELGVTIDPGAIVGPRAEIGSGTIIGANTVIGAGVRIGRDCAIDAQVSIGHALIGDRVVIQSGARIGHGGPPPTADARLVCLGRVIIQNDVEIGANATIARGATGDTVIGEGSRIGALAVVHRDTLIARFGRP